MGQRINTGAAWAYFSDPWHNASKARIANWQYTNLAGGPWKTRKAYKNVV
jgi:hypothetical protein